MALVNRTVSLPAEVWEVVSQLAQASGLTEGDLCRDCMIDGVERQVAKYRGLGLLPHAEADGSGGRAGLTK